ncbi:MAG: hypothetical protein RL669_1969, partial [Pseudomonadota bacterium]
MSEQATLSPPIRAPASDRTILLIVAAYAAAFVVFGLIVDGPATVARGL